MGLFKKLNPMSGVKESIDNVFDHAAGLADQAILDKDALNKLKFDVFELLMSVHVSELQVKTVPWVDALHKMGRQIISLVTVLGIITVLVMGIELTQQDLLALVTAAAPGSIYNWVKGQGK